MIDRSTCPYPVIRAVVEACGLRADVISDDVSLPFSYCHEHADKVLYMLRVEVQVDLSERRSVAEKRQRLDSLELALERA